jgi:hypothetical protein
MPEIVEPIVAALGVTSTTATAYALDSNAYDIAVGGIPFYLAAEKEYPYKRETAPYRRQQIDQTREPGEQSLLGWWLRSQSSFHLGAGVKYQEPTQGETVGYRFYKSAGVDPWSVGKVTLLRSVTSVLTPSNPPIVVGGTDSASVDVVLVADGAVLKRVIADGTSTTLTWGGAGTILALAQDGLNYYAANASGIYRGPLTGATSGTLVFSHPATATTVTLGWVKQRLMAGINNEVHEIVPIATALNVTAAQVQTNVATLTTASPHQFQVGNRVTVASMATAAYNGTWLVSAVTSNTISYEVVVADTAYAATAVGTVVLASNNDRPIYSHSNTSWQWTGVTEGPNCIYLSGYSGTSSSIIKVSLDTSGALPTLTRAVTVAEMPDGEYVTAIASYVGRYITIGTNKGVRVGTIDTSGYATSGFITYGPLSVIANGVDNVYDRTITGAVVKGFTFQDRFAYATVTNMIDNGDGTLSSGLVRIDLSREVGSNQMAWSTDLRTMTTATVHGVAELGTSGRKVIAATDGIWLESTGQLVTEGYLQTGLIRYLTLEDKHFKLIKPRISRPMSGDIELSAVTADGTIRSIMTITDAVDPTSDITTGLVAPAESLAFRFTLNRDTTTDILGSTLTGYQLKALPAVKRSRQLTIPLLNFDWEEDRNNVLDGYTGRAGLRIQMLEDIESVGDVVTIQDFTLGEQVQAVIESVQFVRTSPSNRGYSGFGGILYVTARTV